MMYNVHTRTSFRVPSVEDLEPELLRVIADVPAM